MKKSFSVRTPFVLLKKCGSSDQGKNKLNKKNRFQYIFLSDNALSQ